MFVTMVLAALAVDAIFSLGGLLPSGPRPSRGDVFGRIQLDYKLVLNVLGAIVFVALFWLTARRGATDPVCGMTVDRDKAVVRWDEDGNEVYFCGEGCRETWEDQHEHVPV